jgi:hypothetical protein
VGGVNTSRQKFANDDSQVGKWDGAGAGDSLWAARVAGLHAHKAGRKKAVQGGSSGEEMTERESLLPGLVTLTGTTKIQATCSQAYLRIQDA